MYELKTYVSCLIGKITADVLDASYKKHLNSITLTFIRPYGQSKYNWLHVRINKTEFEQIHIQRAFNDALYSIRIDNTFAFTGL